MAWTDLSSAFGYGTKLTSANMQQLRDNIAAAFAKDSGAPELANNYIVAAMIGTGEVSRTKFNTSTGSISGTYTGVRVTFTMQDYCFFPSIYGSVAGRNVQDQQASSGDTTGRFTILGASGTYDVDYRYITASDEPFIFALINKVSGKIQHVWMCDDPPAGYWGLDERPNIFVPPVNPENINEYEQVTLFKQEQSFLDELRAKKIKDKKQMIEVLNGYEFDQKAQLFKAKNISMI